VVVVRVALVALRGEASRGSEAGGVAERERSSEIARPPARVEPRSADTMA
jgi:hypothetical protein